MRWFKKIFGSGDEKAGKARKTGRAGKARKAKEKAEPGEASTSLALSDLSGWLEDMSRSPEFERKVQDLYRQIEEIAQDLGADVKRLESAAPSEGTPPRLLKAGLASREKVGKQMTLLSQKLALPAEGRVDSAAEYHSGIIKHLENTVLKFGRAQRYMAHLFPEESRGINSDLGRLTGILAELGEAVQEREKELAASRAAEEIASRVRDGRGQIGALQEEVSEDEARLARLGSEVESLKRKIEEMASSREGRELQRLKEDADQRRGELKGLESEMASLVAPMSKALSRMVKQDSSDRLSLQHKSFFELLSRSPAQALEEDVSGALLELKAKLDLLGIRDRKKERILEHVDHLIEEKPLEALKSRHSKLHREIERLEEKLSKSGLETGQLEERLEQRLQQIERLKADLDEQKRNLEAAKVRTVRDEKQLKAKIEKIAGRSIEIDVKR